MIPKRVLIFFKVLTQIWPMYRANRYHVMSNDKVKKALVFYLDPNKYDMPGFGAFSFANVVVIEEDDRNDYPLLMHELRHVRQWEEDKWRCIKSLWDKDTHLQMEVEAYKEQVKAGADIKLMARHLASDSYPFSVTYRKALYLLR